jgi:hypothetical protein
MRFSDFVEYVHLREQKKGGHSSKEVEILDASLRLTQPTAEMAAYLAFVLEGNEDTPDWGFTLSISRALYQLGRLFLLANEGNILDDEALELSFSWNICPECDDAKLLDTVVTANHIANKNLQNVSQGILQRTAFYPLFAVLAKVLKDKTLADVCEEYCSDRPMGQETRAEPADQEG